MTRLIRTTIALLAILLLPMVARAQTATPAADDKAAADTAKPADQAPAAEAKPAEAPKPVAVPLPAVLSKFNVIFYGYVNFDALYDSTGATTKARGWTPSPAPTPRTARTRASPSRPATPASASA